MAILTLEQIENLHSRYIRVVNYINDQNRGYSNGLKIKQVQIPSTLTQSIVYHYINGNSACIGLENIIVESLREGNSRTYDLIYQTNNITINIEVKATGTNDFQRFRPRALTADFILWLNFTGNNYEIAIFNPSILTPRANGEVDITWRTLIQNENITIIRDRTINNHQ